MFTELLSFFRLSTEYFENCYYHELNVSETPERALEHFGGQHRYILMADQTSNIPLVLFSDTESEEEFEGFTARDARPYVEIAVKAPLFCSTPAPKAKRARVESDNHWKFHQEGTTKKEELATIGTAVVPECYPLEYRKRQNRL